MICPKRTRAAARRSGAVLVAALVCLLIVMAVLGSMLQHGLRSRKQMHVQRDLRQCELLLEAGAARAAHRLAGEPAYRGETWEVPAEQIAGSGDGQVMIELTLAASDQPRQLRVVAEYPTGGERSIRRSRTIAIHATTTPMQE